MNFFCHNNQRLIMGATQSNDHLTNPYTMATYMKELGYDAQTSYMRVSRRYGGKLNKKPGHKWRDTRRFNKNDSALLIMTGNILIIDVDDKVENIREHIDIPTDCWLEKTPSGGCHIYFQKDEDIAGYNTNIKHSLWGFKEVDILIKNGFAYAGGTTYAIPEDGKLVQYEWDSIQNPITVPNLGKIPDKWKGEVLETIRNREIETTKEMRPYILGCSGDNVSCAGCDKLSYRYLEDVCQLFSSMEIGRDIIREWTKDLGDTEYIEELISKYMYHNEYSNPKTLGSIKSSSKHTKVTPTRVLYSSIINGINASIYRPPNQLSPYIHKPSKAFIDILTAEGLDDLIPVFIKKIS